MILLKECIILLTIFCILGEAQDKKKFIFDQETEQYYPISALSFVEDASLVSSEPDPKEFSSEFLDSLLEHCDDPTPSFLELFSKAWIALKEMGFNWSRYPTSFNVARRIVLAINPVQLAHAFTLALILTVLRSIVKRKGLRPLTENAGLTSSAARKLIESSWKAFWFLSMWLCSLKVVILSGRSDFFYPLRIFRGVKIEIGYFDIPTPSDYYWLYTLQLGFYLHSFWCVFFMDAWRKDSYILIIHHLLTILLLEGSLILRLHRIGALVVFLHDLNDVFLEVGKVNVYLRIRHKKIYPIHMKLADLCFVLFSTSWVLLRLYWYPLKVLYACSWGVYICLVGREARGFLFFNIMLWGLFIMHLYWFMFIVRMAVRLFNSPIEACEDVREYDSDDSITSNDSPKPIRRFSENCLISNNVTKLNHKRDSIQNGYLHSNKLD